MRVAVYIVSILLPVWVLVYIIGLPKKFASNPTLFYVKFLSHRFMQEWILTPCSSSVSWDLLCQTPLQLFDETVRKLLKLGLGCDRGLSN